MEGNNLVKLVGEIVDDLRFSHEAYGENFYSLNLKVKRLSDVDDVIPVLISDILFDFQDFQKGNRINIEGQFRSYNKHDDSKTRLMLNVFVTDVIDGKIEDDINMISLTGYICKKPTYRKTPLGREITDILVAVNRPHGKSDYIPLVVWGRSARYSNNFCVGDCIKINGRIQSREYLKTVDSNKETRIAYEVSVNNIMRIDEDNFNLCKAN